MTIAISHVLAQMTHELDGGDLSIELDKFGILNQAGHFLYSMHPWNWIQGRSALLNLRGQLSGTVATWTAATNTLTEAAAFTSYSFLDGDEITIADGTGATTGVYKIASRTSANSIVLDGSLSATDLTTGNIDWRIDPQTIDLPDDLRDIIWIASTSTNWLGGVTLTSHTEILQRRASSVVVEAGMGQYYGAVVFTGSPLSPILEIWPSPNANATGAMRIAYRTRWVDVSGDSTQIDIPGWIEDLFIFIARAYVGGYQRPNVASIHQRLAEIRASPIFEAAKRSDGMTQPYVGQLQGGGASIWRQYDSGAFVCDLTTRIPPPEV